ncbi:MAG: transposase [Candidatus Hermodarchaeota archaeon]
MFRRTSPQLSLLEPKTLFPGILPDDDWSYIYRDKIYPLIDENKFKHLYHEIGGAPNKSVKAQISILIFMGIEKLTWREAEFQFQRRIDWMNATCTPFGESNIDHTTLFKLFKKLQDDEVAYQLFKSLTKTFMVECSVSTKMQRVDSFFMHGWLEKLSRYGLFKETNRVFLQNLRKQKPGLYEDIKDDLSRNYLEDGFDLTEKEKDKANRKIQEMAQDLFFLKSAFEKHHQVKQYKSFQTLVDVFEQQCIVKEENNTAGNSQNIEIRERPEGDKIISTPHNTDAEYTRKRDQKVVGHKGFVTETCDPENEVQFITDANLETASHSDSEEIYRIEDRLEKGDVKPEEYYGDAGFVNGKSILDSERRGINLEGPSSGRSQSFEKYESEDRPLDIADFEAKIEEDTKELKVLSCPNKQLPLDQKRSGKTGKVLAHFDSEKCEQCELNERCPVKIGSRVSTLTVDEEQYAGTIRHHKYMGDSEYRKKCGTRAGAESLVNEVANGHGARKSRHRSEEGSRLQLLLAALACNVKRYIRHKVSCAQKQSQMIEAIA